MAIATLLAIAATVFLYLLASNRIIAVAHPFRMAITRLADTLCEDDGIPPETAAQIDNLINHMYSGRRAWFYTLAMSVAMVVSIYRKILGRRDASLDGVPTKKQAGVQVVTALSFISTLLNSPLATFLFIVQFLIYVILFLPVGSLLAELLAISTSIENVESSMRARHSHGHA